MIIILLENKSLMAACDGLEIYCDGAFEFDWISSQQTKITKMTSPRLSLMYLSTRLLRQHYTNG